PYNGDMATAANSFRHSDLHPVVRAIAQALLAGDPFYQLDLVSVMLYETEVHAVCPKLFAGQAAEVVTELSLVGIKPVRVVQVVGFTQFIIPRVEVYESTDGDGNPSLVIRETTSIRTPAQYRRALQEAS
ncbi:MAG TPA: hypothetical protein PLZ57_16435, partial [Pseudobdellovibrionaceae bacterium]|nr:hypothetical protein [Pseudobdellovibrionaceae bacterium]